MIKDIWGMNKKKKLIIVLLLLVALVGTIIYIARPKNHETVEQPKVAETAKENKTDKKTDTKTDDKTDKKNETKTSDKKEDVKSDEKKADTKPEETSTSAENTTSNVSNITSTTTNNTTSNTVSNSASNSTPAPCVPTYTTVNHPAVGHYETRVVKEAENVPVYDRRAVGGQTGRIYNNLSEFDNQDEDYSYSVKTVQVGTEYHEAVTEQVWVEDQPAYTTTEASGC